MRVIVDTGPLVALLHARDQHHAWAVEAMTSLKKPLYTCEPVLAEATHLLGRLPGGRQAVLELVARGAVQVSFRIDGELLALRALLSRYASVPMSLADACLVRMSELDSRATVLTLDSDFHVYRRGGRMKIPLLSPT